MSNENVTRMVDAYQAVADINGFLASARGLLEDAESHINNGRYVVGASAVVEKAKALAEETELFLLREQDELDREGVDLCNELRLENEALRDFARRTIGVQAFDEWQRAYDEQAAALSQSKDAVPCG